MRAIRICASRAGKSQCKLLSYDPYGPASAFFAKPLMKVLYEGNTHLCEQGRKKPYGPTTKAYGLAYFNFTKICPQIGHMIKYLLTKLGRNEIGKYLALRSWRTDLTALGPCAMTSSQIFSHPALPLS